MIEDGGGGTLEHAVVVCPSLKELHKGFDI